MGKPSKRPEVKTNRTDGVFALHLPQEAVEEFKTLFSRQYGVELTDAEASERASRLMGLYRTVLKDEKRASAVPIDREDAIIRSAQIS